MTSWLGSSEPVETEHGFRVERTPAHRARAEWAYPDNPRSLEGHDLNPPGAERREASYGGHRFAA